MPTPDDLVAVAARLEAALDRISRCSASPDRQPSRVPADGAGADPAAQEVAAKLDLLINQLRNALSSAE